MRSGFPAATARRMRQFVAADLEVEQLVAAACRRAAAAPTSRGRRPVYASYAGLR